MWSFAVPHVSATAALVLAGGVLGPNRRRRASRRAERTARDLGTPGYDERYGWASSRRGGHGDGGREHEHERDRDRSSR
jgi:hypothetical protein